MTDVYIVRHGEDEDNAAGILNGHRDKPLTAKGRKQAEEIGRKLKKEGVDMICTSPLKRTRQTADLIAKQLGGEIKPEVWPQLIERDFGVLTGKSVKDIAEYADEIIEHDGVEYFLEGEGVETLEQTLARAQKIAWEINKKHRGEKIVLVTHGDTGKMIRAALLGWPWRKGLETPFLDNTGIIKVIV